MGSLSARHTVSGADDVACVFHDAVAVLSRPVASGGNTIDR